MCGEIRSIATFGEANATDTEEDCWILLGDVTKEILSRTSPPVRRPGRVIYAAFPGRGGRGEDR